MIDTIIICQSKPFQNTTITFCDSSCVRCTSYHVAISDVGWQEVALSTGILLSLRWRIISCKQPPCQNRNLVSADLANPGFC
jgi:hypothetical protein